MNETYSFGEQFSDALASISEAISERDPGEKPGYTDAGFEAAACLFRDAMLDRMCDYQDRLTLPPFRRKEMGCRFLEDLRLMILKYADTDIEQLSRKLYGKSGKNRPTKPR